MNKEQLLSCIIEPALRDFGYSMESESAKKLLLITCAAESRLGFYVRQYPEGPARGIFQMEKRTYYDLFDSVLLFRPHLKLRVLKICSYDSDPNADDLMWNLRLATIMARLQYWRWSQALPKEHDTEGLINYYLKYWGPNPEKTNFEKVEKIVNEMLGYRV